MLPRPTRVRSSTRDLRRHMKESVPGHSSPSSVGMHSSILRISNQLLGCRTALRELREVKELERLSVAQLCIELLGNHNLKGECPPGCAVAPGSK